MRYSHERKEIVIMENSNVNTEIQYLRFQIAALEQLLEVYEKTALEQADKLYGELRLCFLMQSKYLPLQCRGKIQEPKQEDRS